MSTATQPVGARIDGVHVSAYEIPTATEHESDGTLVWDSTTVLVVEVACGPHTGLGYTYCHPAAGQVIESTLASVLEHADPLMPQNTWAQMQVQARQMGHAGIAAMAISAVDVALWDLKAKLLGVCLADLLPRYRDSVPIYGSGGFCNLSDQQLREICPTQGGAKPAPTIMALSSRTRQAARGDWSRPPPAPPALA